MHVTLKALVGRLNDGCRTAFEGAAGLCLTRTHYDVDLEHVILKLLEMPNSDIKRILQAFDVNPSRLERDVTLALDKFKTGNARTPAFAPQLSTLIEEAWLLASLEFGAAKIRSGHLLLALLSKDTLARVARDISKEFNGISVETLDKEFGKITAGSVEAQSAVGLGEQPAGGGADGQAPMGGQTKALDQFTVDLTAKAKAGQIDPILGRDFEIRQVIDILTRRRQNNPIMTGEAGVGKTAVVEGFALRIAQGDVPEPLKHVALRTLDLGLLQAGAGIKGEFENRLKTVIEEVKSSPQPIIIFID
ncbi:MAG: type VI secretion system ATPase TssH, partial [Nitrospirota bacterium]|nr:type VI secretion system ATPase TssH [Nitrospirota bacterium]